MSIIILTRLLLILYSISLFAMFASLLGLIFDGQKRGFSDVKNIILFPFLLMTKHGRTCLSQTLTDGEKK